MTIRTKFGDNVTSRSLRVDQDCLFNDEIVKVWATIEGQTAEKQYWISDLIVDKKKEVSDLIRANWNNPHDAK